MARTIEIAAVQQRGSGVPEPTRGPEVGDQVRRVSIRLSRAASQDHVLPHQQRDVMNGQVVAEGSDDRGRVVRIEDAVAGQDDGAPAVLDQRPRPGDSLFHHHGVAIIAVLELPERVDRLVERVEVDGGGGVSPRVSMAACPSRQSVVFPEPEVPASRMQRGTAGRLLTGAPYPGEP